jgi:hypothetical protein
LRRPRPIEGCSASKGGGGGGGIEGEEEIVYGNYLQVQLLHLW